MTSTTTAGVGERIVVAREQVTRLDLAAYCLASGDRNPIHWSDEAAQLSGLPDVIAHGMLTMGIASRSVVDWAGDQLRLTDMSVRFARPLVVPNTVAGTTVQVAATITDRSADHIALDLEVTAEGGTELLTSARAVLRRRD
jgi:acyl dehydratase